jgi:hypothetical protein
MKNLTRIVYEALAIGRRIRSPESSGRTISARDIRIHWITASAAIR